jgi:DNA (cytosine-5)-methyltransferase 1
MTNLVLSLFPGIGLLDMAFEQEGFCVVRGPDLLWGGNVRSFNVPRCIFFGVIGGPPCQSHVRYAALNKSLGNNVAECLLSEYARICREAQPTWFLMENSPLVPSIEVSGYSVQKLVLNAALFGLEQNRKRMFQFGHAKGHKIKPDVNASTPEIQEKACLASEGASGVIYNKRVNGAQKSFYRPRRSWSRFLELQGLPADYLQHAPFTEEGKYRAVGNGVPLPMGRAIAHAIKLTLK